MDGVAERITHGIDRQGQAVTKTLRKGASKAQAAAEKAHDGEIPFGKMLRCRVRYFSAGAVIGSREFVNEAFANAPERFGAKRKDGARKLKGAASPASGLLWSLRDLKTEPAPAG